MKIHLLPTPFEDLKLIQIDYFKDARGFFIEQWHKKDFSDAGLNFEFVQEGYSRSCKGVIRGLHYQTKDSPMPKIVRCAQGRVFYAIVDVRSNSKTYGQNWTTELSDENQLQLYIPAGFAIGMAALTDVVDLDYKQGGFYNPTAGRTLLWNDPDLNINWPTFENPILSDKDKLGMKFSDYKKNPDY